MPLTLYRTFAWQTFASLLLFTCLVYISTYCMPIATLRQNKPSRFGPRPNNKRCNISSVITPKKISYGSPRKWMSNFTKLHLYMKFTEIYLCFHNSSEMWHSFSRTPMRNFLWCYYRWLFTSLGLKKNAKRMQYSLNHSGTRFLSTEN